MIFSHMPASTMLLASRIKRDASADFFLDFHGHAVKVNVPKNDVLTNFATSSRHRMTLGVFFLCRMSSILNMYFCSTPYAKICVWTSLIRSSSGLQPALPYLSLSTELKQRVVITLGKNQGSFHPLTKSKLKQLMKLRN